MSDRKTETHVEKLGNRPNRPRLREHLQKTGPHQEELNEEQTPLASEDIHGELGGEEDDNVSGRVDCRPSRNGRCKHGLLAMKFDAKGVDEPRHGDELICTMLVALRANKCRFPAGDDDSLGRMYWYPSLQALNAHNMQMRTDFLKSRTVGRTDKC